MMNKLGLGLISYTNTSSKFYEIYHRNIDFAIENGIDFFDTAWAYGNGRSEQFLSQVLKKHKAKGLIFSTKIPAKKSLSPNMDIRWVYPENHIVNFTDKSLKNLNIECIPIQQFHVWEDAWAQNDEWKNTVYKLKKEGKINKIGICVNRNQAENCIETLKTGLIDYIQVVYNLFDQKANEQLFEYCNKNNIKIISRAALENGVFTSGFNLNILNNKKSYIGKHFTATERKELKNRLNQIKNILSNNISIEELALKFVFSEKRISYYLVGISTLSHFESILRVFEDEILDNHLLEKVQSLKWDRIYHYEDQLNEFHKFGLTARYFISKLLL